GTSYTPIAAAVSDVFGRPPLKGATLVVDATGVGRPVVDIVRKSGLCGRLVPVTITAGRRPCLRDGFYRVPKIVLVSTLRALLQQRRLQLAERLAESRALLRELQSLRVEITASLHERFCARAGVHDDLITALALAAWYGERPRTHAHV